MYGEARSETIEQKRIDSQLISDALKRLRVTHPRMYMGDDDTSTYYRSVDGMHVQLHDDDAHTLWIAAACDHLQKNGFVPADIFHKYTTLESALRSLIPAGGSKNERA